MKIQLQKAWIIPGIFFPLLGIILYYIWKENRPIASKYSGIGALVGIVISIGLIVFYIGSIFFSL